MSQEELPRQRVVKQRGALMVRDELREDILWVRMQPGAPLDEVGLAKRFGVSRTPIREALLLLSGERLVNFLQNRTTIVAPFILDNMGDYIDTFLLLSRAAARSAAASGNVDADRLHKLVDQNRSAAESGSMKASFLSDRDFRIDIAEVSQNIFQLSYFRQAIIAGHRSRVICYYPRATKKDLLYANDLMRTLIESVSAGDLSASDEIVTNLVMQDLHVMQRVLEPSTAPVMNIDNYPMSLESAND